MTQKRKITFLVLTIIGLLCIVVITFLFASQIGKPIKNYREKVYIECKITGTSSVSYQKNAFSYSLDQERFYKFDDLQSERLVATDYYINDYVPYQIIVSINNDSEISFSGKHLIGIYSDECVFTEMSDISYWTGSISPYTENTYEMVIWFNKDLSKEQISQYISTLSCFYQLVGNFSYFPNTMVEQTILIPCVFQSSNQGTVYVKNNFDPNSN